MAAGLVLLALTRHSLLVGTPRTTGGEALQAERAEGCTTQLVARDEACISVTLSLSAAGNPSLVTVREYRVC